MKLKSSLEHIERKLKMSEVIKSVIWKRQEHIVNKKKVYTYLIGTILATDEPINGVNDLGDHVVMGEVIGDNDITGAFSRMEKFRPPHKLGDLSSAMLSVADLMPEDLKPLDEKEVGEE